jgi:beta-phosphoglucomutase family hydrolase
LRQVDEAPRGRATSQNPLVAAPVHVDLPAQLRACLFDLDGVLTRTAEAHEAAWAQMFDEFLATEHPDAASPFTHDDYVEYVDGKPRADGIRSFLASRGITVPDGSSADPAAVVTVAELGRRKNDRFLAHIASRGVQVFEGSVRFVRAARADGLGTAVVSSSANAGAVLEAAGIAHLFDARVDGVTAREQRLAGKPAPDTFLAGAAALHTAPEHAVVFEDALAGVEAGHRGAFGLVVGVDRAGQRDALVEHGADVVVSDLAELLRSS